VYSLNIDGNTFQVYCEINGNDIWTVIQRREDASVDFERGIDEYTAGFGDPEGNFWVGLEPMHLLTETPKKLRVDITTATGTSAYAQYSSFSIGSGDDYVLDVSGYSGNAKDSLAAFHNGMAFTTIDRDLDWWGSNCAVSMGGGGGWWYKNCFSCEFMIFCL